MGILYDDVVIIRPSEKEGEPRVLTVNCPDKTGLGCDLCRIILFFGLSIVRVGKLTHAFLGFLKRRNLDSRFCFLFRFLPSPTIVTNRTESIMGSAVFPSPFGRSVVSNPLFGFPENPGKLRKTKM